jgi:tetratricopeptide (TPR) repeat protein
MGSLRSRPVLAGAIALVCLGLTGMAVWLIVWPQARGWYHWWQMHAAVQDSEFEAARAHLQQCLQVWPNSPEVHFHMARVARRDGDLALARQELAVAQRLGWPSSAIELEQQLQQAQAGAVREVEQALKRRVETGHEDSEIILEALTTGYLNINYLADAFVVALYWQKLFPRRWQSHLLMGIIFERRHRADLATAEYRKVLELKPDQAQARHQLAALLLSYSKLYDQALVQYQELVRYHPDYLPGWVGLARCQRALQRYDDARRSLDKALALNPEQPEALLMMGQLAMDQERLEEALHYFQRAIRYLPDDLTANHALASALQELGRHEEAEPYNRRRLQLEQDLRRLDEIRRSIYDLEFAKDEKLGSPMRRSRSVALRREAATLAMRVGDDTDAALWVMSLLQYDPNDPEARRLAAELQARAKEKRPERSGSPLAPGGGPRVTEPIRPSAGS